MSQKFSIALFITFLTFLFSGFAQSPSGGNDLYINSPYSRMGIGDFAAVGNLRNVGMGGTGVSYGDPRFINTLNPALLINNRVQRYDSLLTVLEGSVFGQIRRISNSSASESSGNVGFHSFAYAFPVSKRWTTSIGLNPYSNVSYSLSQAESVSGSPTDIAMMNYHGYGGIYQASFSNGIKVSRKLSLGVQASYLFGSIHHESFSQLITVNNPVKVGAHRKTSYKGFLFRPGISYRTRLQKKSVDSTVFVNIGASYDFWGDFQADQRLTVETRNVNNMVVGVNSASSNGIALGSPSVWRAGISFDKSNLWNIAADFSHTNWESYKGSQGDSLSNSYTIALGGEWGINLKKGLNERDANFKKNYIRAGVSYTKTPWNINGRSVNDFALTLGYSLPVGDSKRNYSGLPLPLLTTAIVVGQRGTHTNSLVKDSYFKIYLGLTINDKWFRKRRVD